VTNIYFLTHNGNYKYSLSYLFIFLLSVFIFEYQSSLMMKISKLYFDTQVDYSVYKSKSD